MDVTFYDGDDNVKLVINKGSTEIDKNDKQQVFYFYFTALLQ